MRWLNRDPLEEEGGVNLYDFVDNNPFLAIDSTGLYLELTMSPTVRDVRDGAMKVRYDTTSDFTAYDIAYAEFRPRFDAAVSNLKKCCSKKALSTNKVCKLIMNPSLKVLVAFEVNKHGIPEPEYGDGTGHFRIFRKKTAKDGKEVYGIALVNMYNTRTRQPVPLFLYHDKDGKKHRESLEALLFHELTHHDQNLDGGKDRAVRLDPSPEKMELERYRSWWEKDAVENENNLRRCCPELNDGHLRWRH